MQKFLSHNQSSIVREFVIELIHFFIINVRASAFGAFLLSLLFLTHFFEVPFIGRYDFIFLMALLYQLAALLFGFEKLREFFVIFLFHIVATIMELFKTNPAIGSWAYPEVETAIFAIATVPLFTGFLYSAVGSYISRAITLMKLTYEHFPPYFHLWIISILIYINFFTHHFVYDIRYLLFAYIFFIFYKTKIHFTVYKKQRIIPFHLGTFLTAFFIWVAENAGTLTNVWLYPHQTAVWDVVPFAKIWSWFLLLMLSFTLVSIVYRKKIFPEER